MAKGRISKADATCVLCYIASRTTLQGGSRSVAPTKSSGTILNSFSWPCRAHAMDSMRNPPRSVDTPAKAAGFIHSTYLHRWMTLLSCSDIF